MLLPVWPPPRSLATTSGISVDVFSSSYLDVSVQTVPLTYLFDSVYVAGVLLRRVSPFGNLRIYAHLQLPAAYRSLSRPSSTPDAKAFSMCSCSLDLRRSSPFGFTSTFVSLCKNDLSFSLAILSYVSKSCFTSKNSFQLPLMHFCIARSF